MRQNADLKQVSYWEPTNIRRHRTKFSRQGDVAPKNWQLSFPTNGV